MKLRIFAEDDRLKVGAILIRNGYRVQQGKEKRKGSKSYDYFLEVEDIRNVEQEDKEDA